jgi:transcriptional regulator with XRE-family HTH domain
MGRRARLRPERLAEKLVQVRTALGLSQGEMVSRLGAEELIEAKRISDYELGKNEPPLPILLEYARAANVIADALIDDELDLPQRLPSSTRHDGIRRRFASRGKK